MKTVTLELDDNEGLYAAFLRLNDGRLGFVSGFASSADEFVASINDARIGKAIVVQDILAAIDTCVTYEHISAPLDNSSWRNIM